jgi:hypothetical protein
MDQHIDCNKQLEIKTADLKVRQAVDSILTLFGSSWGLYCPRCGYRVLYILYVWIVQMN